MLSKSSDNCSHFSHFKSISNGIRCLHIFDIRNVRKTQEQRQKQRTEQKQILESGLLIPHWV